MPDRRLRVQSDYAVQYPDPLRASAGQQLTIVRRDARYPDWVWCSGPDAKEGWVPLAFLDAKAVLQRDYSAQELGVHFGEEVVADEEIGGWVHVTNSARQAGWIPIRCLTSS